MSKPKHHKGYYAEKKRFKKQLKAHGMELVTNARWKPGEAEQVQQMLKRPVEYVSIAVPYEEISL